MEAALPVSPTRSLLHDDEYNTDGARLFFGSLKTPERRISMMVDIPSSPLEDPSIVLGSSNHLAEEILQMEASHLEEDSDEALAVEELMNEVEEGEDDENSGEDEAKDAQDYFVDEPSVILAEKISRATDNPSPPPTPSPVNAFGDFSSFQRSPAEESNEENDDQDENAQVLDSTVSPPVIQLSASPPPSTDEVMELDTIESPTEAPPQPNYIDGDVLPEPGPALAIPNGYSLSDEKPPESALTATDDLLLATSSVSNLTTPEGSTVESSDKGPRAMYSELSPISPPPSTPPSQSEQVDPSTPPVQTDWLALTNTTTPPLRRSPRRSVAPTPSQLPQPDFNLEATPRTHTPRPRRKKPVESDTVGNSQVEDNVEVIRRDVLNLLPETPRAKERSRSRSPLIFNREVGSLSPKTSDLLYQLIPSFTDPTPFRLDSVVDTPPPIDAVATDARPPVFFAPSVEPTPVTPKRPTQPIRPLMGTSPSKPLLSGTQTSNVPATPARRITMAEAIEKGQISPVKAAQMGYTPRAAAAASSSAMPATPARRVLISDQAAPVPSSSRATLRFGSPVRAKSKEPEGVLDVPMADIPVASSSKLIAPSLKPSTSQVAKGSTGGRLAKLPFPITAAKSTDAIGKRPSKPEVAPRWASATQSPAKSSLKQSTSRIPRIGAKPYARPPAKPTASKPPTVIVDKTVTLRKVDLSKPSTNKMVISGTTAVESATKGKGKAPAGTRPVGTPATNGNQAALEKPVALKRKRNTETAKPKAPIRLVVTPATSTVVRGNKAAAAAVPKVGSSRPQRVREPPSRTAPSAPSTSMLVPPPEPLVPQTSSVVDARSQELHVVLSVPESHGSPMQEDPTATPFSDAAVASSPPQDTPLADQQHPVLPVIRIDPPHETPPIETLPPFIPVEIPPLGVRRTSRLRKSTQQVAGDGASESHIPTKTSSRRKQASQNFRFTFTDAYSEMSVTALKNLTAANTVRNQAYLAINLETEIIRKDGARPESPAVKIKTIAQREQERKENGRGERARRRSRRNGGEPGSSDLDTDSEEDELPKVGSEESVSLTPRHRRGAGEEEDYETPHRAFKRMKLTENGPEEAENRRVKWDRDLYTVTFLNEVKLGERPYRKPITDLKGCLAPAAKGLPLDTLGNLPDDKSPLGDLSPEHVVVKKFVYDTDVVEPEPEDDQAYEPPAPKVTRSKKKVAKS